MSLGHPPPTGELEGSQSLDINFQAFGNLDRQALREPVAVGSGLELSGQSVEPCARRPDNWCRGRHERHRLLATSEPVGLLCKPQEHSLGRAQEAAGEDNSPEHPARHRLDLVVTKAPDSCRSKVEPCVQRDQGAVAESATMLEPVLAHPVARQVLPLQWKPAEPGPHGETDLAVRSSGLGHGLLGQPRGSVEAGGIGQGLPYRRQGAGELDGERSARWPGHIASARPLSDPSCTR